MLFFLFNSAPNDYSLVTMMNSVTFSSGSTMGNFECIEINIVEDQRLEADEVFDLTISSSNANVMINGATTTVTIEDNDCKCAKQFIIMKTASIFYI